MIRKSGTITLLFLFLCTFSNQLDANNTGSDEYIILNLHWSAGEITLNSLKKVPGLIKRAGRISSSVQSFFYMLVTEKGEKIEYGYFEIPRKLHYDYFGDSTGELSGGQITREELDFVIKVPSHDNAKQVIFYKSGGDVPAHSLKGKRTLCESLKSDCIGTINF